MMCLHVKDVIYQRFTYIYKALYYNDYNLLPYFKSNPEINPKSYISVINVCHTKPPGPHDQNHF